MAKLILSVDGLVLKEIALAKERLTIGRDPHNDIQIDNPAISGEHAVIVTGLEGHFLEDLGSAGGTRVNGLPVKKQLLRHNDLVGVGRFRLQFIKDTPAGSGREIETMAPAAPGDLATAAIRVLNGASAGKVLDLTKALTSLGKPGVQVAAIARRPQGYFITHVEGDRFPLVNGKATDAQPHPLSDHDEIEIAGIRMEFFLKP